MPSWGDGEEEASAHLTITRAVGTETSAKPHQLESSHADICILYKRKGYGSAGGKRNLHDSAHLTLIFSLSQPRIKLSYRVSLPGTAPVS